LKPVQNRACYFDQKCLKIILNISSLGEGEVTFLVSEQLKGAHFKGSGCESHDYIATQSFSDLKKRERKIQREKERKKSN
jgi:hypothetical protein